MFRRFVVTSIIPWSGAARNLSRIFEIRIRVASATLGFCCCAAFLWFFLPIFPFCALVSWLFMFYVFVCCQNKERLGVWQQSFLCTYTQCRKEEGRNRGILWGFPVDSFITLLFEGLHASSFLGYLLLALGFSLHPHLHLLLIQEGWVLFSSSLD